MFEEHIVDIPVNAKRMGGGEVRENATDALLDGNRGALGILVGTSAAGRSDAGVAGAMYELRGLFTEQ